jgi:glycogen synthase
MDNSSTSGHLSLGWFRAAKPFVEPRPRKRRKIFDNRRVDGGHDRPFFRTIARLEQGMDKKRILIEIAWEVCNQVGGIYTVLRSKVPAARKFWRDDYCLVGPWFPDKALGEFEEEEDGSVYCRVCQRLRERGIRAKHGRWLVSGQPRVVLIDIHSTDWGQPLRDVGLYLRLNVQCNDLVKKTTVFSFLAQMFVGFLAEEVTDRPIVAHFHEWMSSAAVAFLRSAPHVRTICSTHATLLGRYLASAENSFYEALPYYNWYQKAGQYNIGTEAQIERQAAHNCHVFTTLSSATDRECEVFLGRKADVLLPNGLSIERFTALHEFQNLHLNFKKKIHEFTMAHFFQSDAFDLDKTLYFFTSGRFEYRNKGFDLTVAALSQLNERLKAAGSPVTVVFFFVTKRECDSMNPEVLESHSLMQEVNRICGGLFAEAKQKFFEKLVSSKDGELPDINRLITESARVRLRSTILHWKKESLPKIVTHNLRDNTHDPLLNDLRRYMLWNKRDDRVKVVYHPDFITAANPLFGMDYHEFVRGCHLGVFPSYYEPWGYTPLEAIASGIPTVTSDLAGFGTYLEERIRESRREPVKILKRYKRDYWDAVGQLSEHMHKFCQLNRRERITVRNQTEELSSAFDWEKLYASYKAAYRKALKG